MNRRNIVFATILLLSLYWTEIGNADENAKISTRIELHRSNPLIVYEVKNTSDQKLNVARPELGSSPIYIRHPSGDVSGLLIIADPPTAHFLQPKEIARRYAVPLASIGYSTGLYHLWMKVKGVDTEKVAVYRELNAPRIDPRFGEDIDDARVVIDLLQVERFEQFHRQLRQEQYNAFEGMKQFVMVNPYILALSADGKPGFRLKLMATNNTQAPLELPAWNTVGNRIEIVGLNEDNVWSFPSFPMPQDTTRKLQLKIGETRSEIVDIGRYIVQNGIRLPGRYTVRWIVNEQEKARFVFYLPTAEEKAEAEKEAENRAF